VLVPPSEAEISQPTLWRTCRVIANQKRLEIFECLVQTPGQTVTSVAQHCSLPLSVASESLRMLESRGLLTVQRVGRWVKYRLCSGPGGRANSGLVAALRTTFQRAGR
jgi:DNA-binding transcriptional ArsR family regulator